MKKLIINSLMLVLSLIMCITVTIAWFTKNLEVTAENIQLEGLDADYSLVLQYYNGTSFVDAEGSNILQEMEIEPGDIYYYRIVLSGSSVINKSITAFFKNVATSVSDEITYDSTKKCIKAKNVNLFDVKDNAVKINDSTLYTVLENQISLVDYKLEDAMKFYFIAQKDSANNQTYTSFEADLETGIQNNTIEGCSITENTLFNTTVAGDSSYYLYFALELSSSINYLYQFQELFIECITLSIN